ncbi:MAG: hypothetical protein ACK5YU_10635 [Burkholderiales bacterium]|jgi:hypothetical protein|nr:hypothetical protein [Betaproteobacteria bacterium]
MPPSTSVKNCGISQFAMADERRPQDAHPWLFSTRLATDPRMMGCLPPDFVSRFITVMIRGGQLETYAKPDSATAGTFD